ncbi:3-hydroxyacyl-CoA dehydrogenase [Allopusillimonas ginsengisoli]|uniref:3-hydroxyacyl-CoA dehydrogenase n=1 Tax=Allopusillimonas ginsengisoli TaxID=453575 RepID=UPI00102267A0|nr:3-hydroxyacyl-CoA dehydrogenase [Allopusillimonas ginsengisoli]TEA79583.1 3-hydroxyacyl-CoA dehydrogenase [Allopusillimonas ginsengisoli]
MNVAVIGAGLIGQAWAIVFARGGCEVKLWDGDPDALVRAHALIGQLVNVLHERGLLADAPAVMARIRVADDLALALDGAEYVQENLPEKLEIKQDIFARMDQLADGGTVLASSTSSIPASLFSASLQGRERCLVAHPVNPPYLVPVVELCGAPWTSQRTVDHARHLMQAVGQKPVTVNRELEGFVLNRLQGALLREAFRLVGQGYVSVEDLDVTVKDGLGLRWAFMGPFETIDLNAPDGLQDYCARYGGMFQSIATEQASTEAWDDGLVAQLHAQRRDVLPREALLDRRLWRDERLMALLLHKQQQDTAGPS